MKSPKRHILGWRGAGAAAALLLLSGCMVGPNYTAPATTLPADYAELPATQPAGVAWARASEREARWWRRLNDAKLDDLVERALAANASLTVAEARLRQARAAREAAQAALYPEIHAGASLLRFRVPTGALGVPQGLLSPQGTLYQAGFNAIWEVDVFGGTRREVESARADEGMAAATRRGVVLMVAAETTRAYVELRGVQYQLQVAEATWEQQRQILAITQDKHRQGLASDLDLLRAQTDVDAAEADLPPLQQAVRQYIHLLGTLLALEPTALSGALAPVTPIPRIPGQIQVGVPSDLLRRRPDIQAAERHLASATAQVGVAVSKLFPQLAIGGTAGIANRTDKSLSLSSGGYYATGPFIDWTVFDAGRRQAAVNASKAEVDAAKASYEDSVRRAFAEVESTLVAVDRAQARRDALKRLVGSARATVNIARRDWQTGILDQLAVLDAQRQANRADMALAQSEVTLVVNVVTLYKALGGGWEAAEPGNSAGAAPATQPASAKP